MLEDQKALQMVLESLSTTNNITLDQKMKLPSKLENVFTTNNITLDQKMQPRSKLESLSTMNNITLEKMKLPNKLTCAQQVNSLTPFSAVGANIMQTDGTVGVSAVATNNQLSNGTVGTFNGTVGTFYNVVERNGELRDRQFQGFNICNPAPGLSAPNVTRHVIVPSSEHVAEIVGRQGCKIKALRNKTNTYIKTPGRGEDPLFIITGQMSNVEDAVTEIERASAHFTNIRATRNRGLAAPSVEGQITDRVQVPYRVVGLVVGPKGQTIKQIQTKTNTYIVTPSRERDPIFEITGLPENVAKAREEIISYITVRTGMFLEENAIGNLTFQPNAGAGGLNSKMSTGIWNPTKQDIDEFDSVSDVLHGLCGDLNTSPRTAAGHLNVRPFTGRSLSLATNGGQQSFASKTTGSEASRRPSTLPNGEVNDENRDPLRGFGNRDVSNLLLSPMRDLNVNTGSSFMPFAFDSSSILRRDLSEGQNDSSPEPERGGSGFRFGYGGMTASAGNFGMSDLGKVSPGSQHSSATISPILPSTVAESISRSHGQTVASFGDSHSSSTFAAAGNSSAVFASNGGESVGVDTWLYSPPRTTVHIQQSRVLSQTRAKCLNCHVGAVNVVLTPCGHKTSCSSCAEHLIGMQCAECCSQVQNYFRIF